MNSSTNGDAFVHFDQVWLAYNEELLAQNTFAVEDINLKVRQGEFIAIVGPSGCGKSTFMKLTTGLKMPSRGTITIDGQAVTGPLKISGMAFQAPSLLPWRTHARHMGAEQEAGAALQRRPNGPHAKRPPPHPHPQYARVSY